MIAASIGDRNAFQESPVGIVGLEADGMGLDVLDLWPGTWIIIWSQVCIPGVTGNFGSTAATLGAAAIVATNLFGHRFAILRAEWFARLIRGQAVFSA